MQSDIESTVEKARELLHDRLTVLENLKRSESQENEDRARLKESQQQRARDWTACLGKGWTEEELKKLGFKKPDTRPVGRPGGRAQPRRSSTKSTPNTASASSMTAPASPPQERPGAASPAANTAESIPGQQVSEPQSPTPQN